MFNTAINQMFQNVGGWLSTPMLIITALGYEYTYLVLMAILYWCVNDKLGFRVGVMLLLSTALTNILKISFHTPRPYWIDEKIIEYSSESSFGFPSGHALISSATYGRIGAGIKNRYAKYFLFLIILLIGLSRIYLGVHFLGDVLGGWIIGSLILLIGISFEKRKEKYFNKSNSSFIILLGILVSILIIGIFTFLRSAIPMNWESSYIPKLAASFNFQAINSPLDPSGVWTVAGAFLGMITGRLLIMKSGGFDVNVSTTKKVLRVVVGFAGILILWAGAGIIFPEGESLIALIYRYLRYFLIGFWISCGAPLLFNKIEFPRKVK